MAQPESEEAHRGLPRALEVLRVRAGLSRDALASSAGMSRSAVLKIERGERTPSPQTLKKLAGALEISPDELLAAGWVAAEDDPGKRRTRAATITSALLAADLPLIGLGSALGARGGVTGGVGKVLGLVGAISSARGHAQAASTDDAAPDPAVTAANEHIDELTRQVDVLTQRLADMESRLQELQDGKDRIAGEPASRVLGSTDD